jgi:hypothetical protein
MLAPFFRNLQDFTTPHLLRTNTVNQAAHHHQHSLRPSQNSMGGIPPASPLFPRVTDQATAGLVDQHRVLDGPVQQPGNPLRPGPPYLCSQLGHSAMYPNIMGAYHYGTSNNSMRYSDLDYSMGLRSHSICRSSKPMFRRICFHSKAVC